MSILPDQTDNKFHSRSPKDYLLKFMAMLSVLPKLVFIFFIKHRGKILA